MLKSIERLKFLSQSTNEHGVHSPFIYNYVTICLYGKTVCKTNKSLNVVLNTLKYFKQEKLGVISEIGALKELKGLQFSPCIERVNYFDNPADKRLIELLTSEVAIKNDCILIVDNLYKNQHCMSVWSRIKNNQKVTVTVDMYYCGAVFFRKEQAKEHFKIRI